MPLFCKNSMLHLFKVLMQPPKPNIQNNVLQNSQGLHRRSSLQSKTIHENVLNVSKLSLLNEIDLYMSWLHAKNQLIRTLNFTNHSFATIKERIYDKSILFTRLLHIQSNVYLTLQVRRIAQLCLLYRRIYSPTEFHNVFFENLLNNCKFFKFLNREYRNSIRKCFAKRKLLLAFAGCYAFSWDDNNRISEQEFDELIQDFTCNHNKYSFEKNSESNGSTPNDNSPQEPNGPSNDSSFMVVNCMQANNDSISSEWEEIISRPHFNVWRKSVNNSTLYQYKVYGSFDDISAYSFYSVQKDLEYRKEWDKLVIKLDVIDAEPRRTNHSNRSVYDSGNELIHWIMKYPYPMMNREYLYVRRYRIDHGKKFIVLISRSVSSSSIPESPENVRVVDYMSHMVIKPHEDFHKPGFEFMLTYFDDPRASFPSPAYAWMAARGVPDFVEKLHQAALRFSMEKNSLQENWNEQMFYDCNDEDFNKFDTPNQDEIRQGFSTSIPTTNNNVVNKILSKLPEPVLDYDSLIWN